MGVGHEVAVDFEKREVPQDGGQIGAGLCAREGDPQGAPAAGRKAWRGRVRVLKGFDGERGVSVFGVLAARIHVPGAGHGNGLKGVGVNGEDRLLAGLVAVGGMAGVPRRRIRSVAVEGDETLEAGPVGQRGKVRRLDRGDVSGGRAVKRTGGQRGTAQIVDKGVLPVGPVAGAEFGLPGPAAVRRILPVGEEGFGEAGGAAFAAAGDARPAAEKPALRHGLGKDRAAVGLRHQAHLLLDVVRKGLRDKGLLDAGQVVGPGP